MVNPKLFMAGCLLAAAALYLIVGGGSHQYNGTGVETTKEKGLGTVEKTKEKGFAGIQVQPFQNLPPNECCPFAQQVYKSRYKALNYRCCTDRLDSLEDLREESLTLASFQMLENTTILLQGDSLAEQHFVSLLCFLWRYGDAFQIELTISHVPNPYKLHGWKATIQPLNTSIELLRWNIVQVCPTKDYQEDFVILGGWHHEGPDTVKKAMGPFLKQIQSMRAKRQYTTILNEALPAHFPGGHYRYGDPDGYPPPKVLAKYYSKNNNGTSTNHTPFCDSSTNQGTPNINGMVKTWTQQYNLTLLPVFDIYKDRGDAHVGKPSAAKERDCLHWCVEALDALALQTWLLLATLQQSSREGDKE